MFTVPAAPVTVPMLLLIESAVAPVTSQERMDPAPRPMAVGAAVKLLMTGLLTGLFTVIVSVAVVLPPEFDAVTVYAVATAATVGVPVRVPAVALRLKPAGRAGLRL